MLREDSGAWGRTATGQSRTVDTIFIKPTRRRTVELAVKYGLDRAVSFFALVSFAPFIGLVVVLCLVFGGHAIRADEFIGQGGRAVRLYRFAKPATREPRMRRLSAFLADSGLEDMLLLFNVLRGDLSFIGPLPNRDPDAPHVMRPGLFMPAARDAGQRLARDLEYTEHFSLMRDAAIACDAIRQALGLAARGERQR